MRSITYHKVFGISLSEGQGDGRSVHRDEADYDIIDDDDVVVAQVSGNTLLVLFDLPHGSVGW